MEENLMKENTNVETKDKKKICILVAAYNEEEVLNDFYNEVTNVVDRIKDYDFEILFVNDGSKDRTLEIMKELRQKDGRVSYVNLSRNHGKELAVYAGIMYVTEDTDAVAFFDADLQDPPSLIPEFIKWWEQGYDQVYAKRNKRAGETFFKKFTSKMYYKVVKELSDIDVDVDTGDCRLIDKRCINILKQMPEVSRNNRTLFNHMGYKQKAVLFDRHEREAGETKFNLTKMVDLAIEGVIGAGKKLIRHMLKIVMTFGLISFALLIWYLVALITKGHNSELLLYTILTIFMTILTGMLWIIAEYIGTIYTETKARKAFYVDEYNGKKIDNSEKY